MFFSDLPDTAAWQHRDVRQGFEVVYFDSTIGEHRVEGCTTAVEEGQTWVVDYTIELDHEWVTRRAQITGRSAAGSRTVTIEADGLGRWQIDGRATPYLDGCLDLDLESSAMTNAFPVHRMGLPVGAEAAAPAAYIRATTLIAERLEQQYVHVPGETGQHSYDYRAPEFDVACRLVYDQSGLVLDYPGIAVRAY